MDDGTRLRLASEGQPGSNGGPGGDLYVFLKVKPHPFFERRERRGSCSRRSKTEHPGHCGDPCTASGGSAPIVTTSSQDALRQGQAGRRRIAELAGERRRDVPVHLLGSVRIAVRLEFKDSQSAGQMRPEDPDAEYKYRYVLMPMRI